MRGRGGEGTYCLREHFMQGMLWTLSLICRRMAWFFSSQATHWKLMSGWGGRRGYGGGEGARTHTPAHLMPCTGCRCLLSAPEDTVHQNGQSGLWTCVQTLPPSTHTHTQQVHTLNSASTLELQW